MATQLSSPTQGQILPGNESMLMLLPVKLANIGGEDVQSVDARELHSFLGIVRDFNQWMREQVERARLVRERDYVSYEEVGNPLGGRPRKGAILTLDSAKHIAMMSGAARGFEVRDYFIECERRARAVVDTRVPRTMAEALRLAADQAEQIELQAAALAVAAPKAEFYDRVVEREALMNATQVGQKFKLSAVKLNQVLETMDVYHGGIKRGRAFKQWFVDKGYGIMKATEAGYPQPLFTTAGEAWVVQKMIAEGY